MGGLTRPMDSLARTFERKQFAIIHVAVTKHIGDGNMGRRWT
jgi:hypothetical protein